MKYFLTAVAIGAFFTLVSEGPLAFAANLDPVAEARRAYRDTCDISEPRDFCVCQSSGMAQELTPEDMRIARTALRSHRTELPQSIADVRDHYADACVAFRSPTAAMVADPSVPVEAEPADTTEVPIN